MLPPASQASEDFLGKAGFDFIAWVVRRKSGYPLPYTPVWRTDLRPPGITRALRR